MTGRGRRLLVILLIVLACLAADQATKAEARRHLAHAAPSSYLGGTVRIQYTENSGAFLSLGAKLPEEARFWILVVITGAVTSGALIFVMVKRSLHPLIVVAVSLLAGGGAGNLVDRIRYEGAVVDFMNLGIGPVRTGIFNVADVAIMAGAALVLYLGIRESYRKDPS